jgi:hypothetical protein
MPPPLVLYSSAAVHSKIQRLFANPSPNDRRVVIVAYVGADALKLLPHPNGVQVVCCPEPLATSHIAVRALLRKGAKVQFADRLHAKVYWSRQRGCIIGSANLSRNALGAKGLKEAGVYLRPGAVNIDRLLAAVSPRKITQSELEEMARETRKAVARGNKITIASKPSTFLDWFHAPLRDRSWKLSWWETSRATFAKVDREMARNEFGVTGPYEFIEAVTRQQIRQADWLLCFKIVDDERIATLSWMFINFVVNVPRSDPAHDADFPHHAVQVLPLRYYPDPPFELTSKFKTAFRLAAQAYGIARLKALVRLHPPETLLRMTAEHMQGAL